MICETCHGKGQTKYEVTKDALGFLLIVIPCPDCGGSGVAYCCEGLQAQPTENPDATDNLE